MIGILRCTCVSLSIALAWSVPVARAQLYDATDLGTLQGDTHSHPRAVNDAGQVVGYSTSDLIFGPKRAFLWEAGLITDLGTLGGEESSATGIDSLGNVVGSSATTSTLNAPSHAFFLETQPMEDLGTLGGLASWADDLGKSGDVVGGSRLAGDEFHPCRWESTGGISDLGVLSGHCCGTARAANSAGSVVGFSSTVFSQSRAVVWRGGQISDLGTLSNGCCSEAFDINDAEQIVGFSWLNGRTRRHACLWERGTKSDLGALPGGLHSEAFAINSAGWIVGVSWAGMVPPGDPRACVWHDGRVCDLNEMVLTAGDWEFTEARDINNLGQIVVIAVNTETGNQHGFLLTPIERRRGDFNGDTVVNLTDYVFLFGALEGPNAGPIPAPTPIGACASFFDSDHDDDIDLCDVAAFQSVFDFAR